MNGLQLFTMDVITRDECSHFGRLPPHQSMAVTSRRHLAVQNWSKVLTRLDAQLQVLPSTEYEFGVLGGDFEHALLVADCDRILGSIR